MLRFFCCVVVVFSFIVGCQGQSKEELLHESEAYIQQGNYRGALVLLKNALEKDPAYQPARLALADIYLTLGQSDRALSELEKAEAQGSNVKLLIMRADAYLSKGMTTESLSTLGLLPVKDRESAEALNIRGRAYAVQEDWRLAEKSLRKAVVEDSNDQSAHLNLCRVIERQQRSGETKACLKDCISKWPSLSEGVLLLAQLEIQDGNIEQALLQLEEFVKAGHGNDEVLYRLGTLYQKKRDYEKAISIATKIQKEAPKSRYGDLLAGQNALLSRNLSVALERLSKAARTQRDSITEFMLGLTRYEMGSFEQALNHFQNSLDLDPDFHQSRLMVASTLLKQKRFDDSLYIAQIVLEHTPQNIQALRIVAAVHMAKENFDEADKYLKRAIEIAPDQQDLYLRKSEFEFLAGDVTTSMETLKSALAKDPENLRARLYLVADAARRQNYQYAMQIIREGLVGKPSDAVLINTLGRLYLAQDRPKLAEAQFVEAQKLKPTFKAPYFNLAQIALKSADYPTALSYFDAILTLDPDDLTSLLNKARLLEAGGDSENALNTLIRARETGSPKGLFALSQFYAHKGRIDEALDTITEGLNQSPKQLQLLELKAALYREKNEFDSALEVYKSIDKIAPGRGLPSAITMAISTNNLDTAKQLVVDVQKDKPGSAYGSLLESYYLERTEGPQKALTQLKSSLSQVADKNPLYQRIAYLSDRSGHAKEAIWAVKRWAESDPNNFQAHFTLGVFLERHGEVQQAAQSYRQCLKLNNRYVPAMNNLAYLFTDQMGRPKDALPLAQKAVQLNPGNGAVLDTLGYVYHKLAQYDDAKDMLQKAINISPEQGVIRFHLAKTLLKLGEKEAAKKHLQASLEGKITPPRIEVEKLLKNL